MIILRQFWNPQGGDRRAKGRVHWPLVAHQAPEPEQESLHSPRRTVLRKCKLTRIDITSPRLQDLRRKVTDMRTLVDGQQDAGFPLRQNSDGSYDSICPRCFRTVGTGSLAALKIAEYSHCCEWVLRHEMSSPTLPASASSGPPCPRTFGGLELGRRGPAATPTGLVRKYRRSRAK